MKYSDITVGQVVTVCLCVCFCVCVSCVCACARGCVCVSELYNNLDKKILPKQ